MMQYLPFIFIGIKAIVLLNLWFLIGDKKKIVWYDLFLYIPSKLLNTTIKIPE